MELVSEAIIFAAKAHDGMRRKKSEQPYILHPVEAAAIAGSITTNQEIIAAAALHDVVEDAGITIEEITESFGKRVAELVLSETENKREKLPAAETWEIRKKESIKILRETNDIGVKILYLSDKLANLRSIYNELGREGNAFWQRFNQKDPSRHEWYYRSIVANTKELSETLAWKEFNGLIDSVFVSGKFEQKENSI